MYSISFRCLNVKYKNFDEWFSDFNSSKRYKANYQGKDLRPLRVKFAINLLPELSYLNTVKKIHVTGSSGKSSCSKIWGEFLYHNGFSAGVITKPHVCKYNERYWFNGDLADDKTILPIFEKVMKINEQVGANSNYGSLRYVEAMFIVGLLYFSKMKLDYLVIEAGIGALYDYTNVFEQWEVGVITSVHNEHRRRLGGSIDSIIGHKVAIANKSKRAYVLEKSLTMQKSIVSKIHKDVEILKLNNSFEVRNRQVYIMDNGILEKKIPLNTNLVSDGHLVDLASVVHFVNSKIKVNDEISYNIKLLGRLDTKEFNDKLLVFDTAHTPESVAGVINTVNKIYPSTSKYLFLAVTGKKKGKRMIELIKSNVNKIYTVRLKIKGVPFNYYSNLGEQEIDINEILSEIDKLPKDSIIIFTGSIYYVGYVMGIF